ncbi:Gldg family protein [Rhodothermus marinus]|uniref:Gldg family protein n=1 Tax=Rhodothermus marinus TaxID=29549 RepID=UPI003F6E4780
MQPAMLPDPENFRDGPYVLAVALHGTFPSAYDSTRVGQPARLVVVGDGDLVNEQRYGGQLPPGNLAFVLNIATGSVRTRRCWRSEPSRSRRGRSNR